MIYHEHSIESVVFLLIPPTGSLDNDMMCIAAGSDYDK